MLFLKASAPSIKGFTLVEMVIVLAILAVLATLGMGISFSQYGQWMVLARREDVLDGLIETRSTSTGTSSAVIISSYGTFSESITLYEDGELHY